MATATAQMPTTSESVSQLIIVQSNSLRAVANPENPIKPIFYGTLLDCFIDAESGGNKKALNPCDIDGRPKYGCLQFDERTFHEFCVVKYGLPDDIWNCDVQSSCWQDMYMDGLVGHWGRNTLNACL
jgi:hypothetical protein